MRLLSKYIVYWNIFWSAVKKGLRTAGLAFPTVRTWYTPLACRWSARSTETSATVINGRVLKYIKRFVADICAIGEKLPIAIRGQLSIENVRLFCSTQEKMQ